MLAAVVLSIILVIIIVAVAATVARNAVAAAYRRGFQEAKALYSTGQSQAWEIAATDVLQWVNDGFPSAQKPKNPYI